MQKVQRGLLRSTGAVHHQQGQGTHLRHTQELAGEAPEVTGGDRRRGASRLGDLLQALQGIEIASPVAKSCLYTSMGGLDPADVLPVCIDVGTNNEALLNDPLYIGQKTRRVEGEEYDELMDEFVASR